MIGYIIKNIRFMEEKTIRPCGTWPQLYSFQEMFYSNETVLFPKMYRGELYWVEKRPSGEKTLSSMEKKDLLPPGYSPQTLVHEYGGVPYFVCQKGIVFSNGKDQNLYLLQGSKIEKLTTTPGARYADGTYDEQEDAFYFVRELREQDTVRNTLVRIQGTQETVFATGHDFYSNPNISPDGNQLALLAWDLPFMPWQRRKLYLYHRNQEGTFVLSQVIGEEEEAISEPRFSPKGVLHFISDRSGYANLYRYKDSKIESIAPSEKELSLPSWIFGLKTYGFLDIAGEERIACQFLQEGRAFLGSLDPKTGTILPYELPFENYAFLEVAKNTIYCLAEGSKQFESMIRIDHQKRVSYVLSPPKKQSSKDVSLGEILAFPTRDGQKAYGVFYPPKHPKYTGNPREKPPLLVKVHSGPTSLHLGVFSHETQFWTSQGFAYLAVNYRGSTGFGKAYRDKLNGRFGEIDVEDCVDGALHLAHLGYVHPEKMAIRGGSSGGYTALVAASKGVFLGAVSYYGISNLEELLRRTHKFEKGYNETLIGPYPEKRSLYQKRSPIYQVDEISSAVLLLHGENDPIVPKSQSETLYKELKRRGKQAYLAIFPDEGHGFRSPITKQKAWELERYFYQKIFGLETSSSAPWIEQVFAQ